MKHVAVDMDRFHVYMTTKRMTHQCCRSLNCTTRPRPGCSVLVCGVSFSLCTPLAPSQPARQRHACQCSTIDYCWCAALGTPFDNIRCVVGHGCALNAKLLCVRGGGGALAYARPEQAFCASLQEQIRVCTGDCFAAATQTSCASFTKPGHLQGHLILLKRLYCTRSSHTLSGRSG